MDDTYLIVERRIGMDALAPVVMHADTKGQARLQAEARLTPAHLYVILYKMDRHGNIETDWMGGPRD